MNKPKYATFVSFKTGMRELVEGLLTRLDGDLRLNTGVRSIKWQGEGMYSLMLSDDTQISTDHVILTTPAHITARLLKGVSDRAAELLAAIRYVSTGTITLAYKRADIAHPMRGFGVVIPRSEKRPINAITWTSTKFYYRAPEGYALIRVFFGGSRTPQSLALSDADLLDTVRGELRSIMGIEAAPLFTRIHRWHEANPQYDVGHLDRIDALEAALPPGIHLTGSAYRGIGIPDCVHQGQQMANKVAGMVRVGR